MKFTNEEKVKIYKESFEILKDSFYDYENEIKDLIVDVSMINAKDSIAIWKELLKTYIVEKDNGYTFSEDSNTLIKEILEYIMINSTTYEFATEIVKDEYMIDKVFATSGSMGEGHALVITDLINFGKFDEACELICTIKKNPNINKLDGFNIDDIIVLNLENIDDDEIEDIDSDKILGLIDQIEDEKKKAVAKIQLISKME